ncbi:DUF1822 family protein [Pleurocapsa sp. CCALA 161]|uniref:DUF1822 family protein n=1 Tax=Pleurocapsa sp. CCALA 161 TaxID=2107688 RepID=UPI0018EA9AD3|nr:DUF1822 family protein [Pleurocapsa sp. CCALA 161]
MLSKNNTLLSVLPSRQLEIVGQQYLLNIIDRRDTVPNGWRFQLQNKREGGLVPGGFKLRLATESRGSLSEAEAVATKAQQRLYIDVVLQPETTVVWEIEPLPDNYQREILIF